jgi:hypothetical protein
MRDLAIVLLSLIWTLPLTAQRHGRPDSSQNYARGISPPEIVLKLETTHQEIHLRTSDLDKLKRSAMAITSPNTNKITKYEGVFLGDLLAAAPQHQETTIVKVSYGFFHSKIFSTAELNPASEPLIADMANGEHLFGDMPFCLIAKDRQGHDLLIRNVTAIRFMQSR